MPVQWRCASRQSLSGSKGRVAVSRVPTRCCTWLHLQQPNLLCAGHDEDQGMPLSLVVSCDCMQVDNSIAATFQNFPVKEPPAGSTASAKAPIATDAGSHGALNLLDFDDDPPAAAAPPAASGSAAAAAEDDDWADFSGAAAPHPSTPDPFSGATVPAASAGGAPSVPDDPFSMLAPAAPPPPLAAATAPPAAAPAAPAQSSGRQPLPMDAFAEPLSAVVPQATAALGPATPAVTVQPTAGTSAGPESAANGAAGFDPFAGASLPAHGATAGGAALKGGALKDEKDPFADLL